MRPNSWGKCAPLVLFKPSRPQRSFSKNTKIHLEKLKPEIGLKHHVALCLVLSLRTIPQGFRVGVGRVWDADCGIPPILLLLLLIIVLVAVALISTNWREQTISIVSAFSFNLTACYFSEDVLAAKKQVSKGQIWKTNPQ